MSNHERTTDKNDKWKRRAKVGATIAGLAASFSAMTGYAVEAKSPDAPSQVPVAVETESNNEVDLTPYSLRKMNHEERVKAFTIRGKTPEEAYNSYINIWTASLNAPSVSGKADVVPSGTQEEFVNDVYAAEICNAFYEGTTGNSEAECPEATAQAMSKVGKASDLSRKLGLKDFYPQFSLPDISNLKSTDKGDGRVDVSATINQKNNYKQFEANPTDASRVGLDDEFVKNMWYANGETVMPLELVNNGDGTWRTDQPS